MFICFLSLTKIYRKLFNSVLFVHYTLRFLSEGLYDSPVLHYIPSDHKISHMEDICEYLWNECVDEYFYFLLYENAFKKESMDTKNSE